MNKVRSQWIPGLWIIGGFAVWIFAFRGYLSSRLELTYDALSYYDHTKFFIENLGHGVYPLWDPFMFYGAPNDFFLRRIGAFNPFYLFILLFKSVGIPYTISYIWFLAGYYWMGMIAFYLLAMRIFNDRMIAYAGYLILLFSALGTRLFDSYMMLVTVPLICFFYFLVSFTQTPRKHLFLGLVLFFMILLGTYIPFYFLIILVMFTVFFILFYYAMIPKIFSSYAGFFKKNKGLVIISALILVLSIIPAIDFFHESTQGQIILPIRHGDASLGHTLTVPHQTLDWGAVEDLVSSAFYSNLKLFKFAVVYIPFFSAILLFLGLMGRINRRAAFIFLLGVGLFCSIVPHGLPFYDFFYHHIFFMKYFRNLHFFIWFFLIPLFVLLALEHWNMYINLVIANPRKKWLLLYYAFCVHLIAFLFVFFRHDAIFSSYLMIILSFIFWSLMTLKKIRTDNWGFLLLTLTIIVQPLEVYHYLSLKSFTHPDPYGYNFSFSTFDFKDTQSPHPEDVPITKTTYYYVSGAYNFVYQNIDTYPLAKYLQYKLLLVDRVELVDRHNLINTLQNEFLNDGNKAVILNETGKGIKLESNDPFPALKAQHLQANTPGIKLLSFDADHLSLSLDLPYEKFLVYNDNYDPQWQVFVNHVKVPLYETNGAFKGVWVPAGKSIVEFNYGSWRQYAINIMLSVFAFILLLGIIIYARLP